MATILFIHHVGLRTGAGVMLKNIIQALDPAKFRAVVVSPPGDIVGDLEKAGAKVIVADRPVRKFPHTSGFTWPAYSRSFLVEAYRQWRDID